MSFGWAPSGDALNGATLHGVNFFSRLEADQKFGKSQCIIPSRKRKRKSVPSLREMIAEELRRIAQEPPGKLTTAETFGLGSLSLLLNYRDELHKNVKAATTASYDASERFSLYSRPLMFGKNGVFKGLRTLILEAASYRQEIILCTTNQQFYDSLKNTFLDIRQATSSKSVSRGLISCVFLLSWTDFLRADFPSFNYHVEGLVLLLQSYKASLNGSPFSPSMSLVSQIGSMKDACIAFFGDKQRFPSDLVPRDHKWLQVFLHTDDIARATVFFRRSEWMRTVSTFKKWAATQRAAVGFEDPFVEEAIARQGDAITADIVAWGEHAIPKYIETPTSSPGTEALIDFESSDEFSPYFSHPVTPKSDAHQFLHFPKVEFQSTDENEMALVYLGLLLLMSYSTYPQIGHLPFSRWELAVKFCQCFAAFPDHDDMDIINRILHLFYARITFDDSFPQERKWCDHQWSLMKEYIRKRSASSDVISCFITFMEREWGVEGVDD